MSRYARKSDPHTSHDAANKADVNTLQLAVLTHLKTIGPASTNEISEATGIPRDSLSPRIPVLREKGLVEDSGERRGHPRKCIVWRLKPNQPSLDDLGW